MLILKLLQFGEFLLILTFRSKSAMNYPFFWISIITLYSIMPMLAETQEIQMSYWQACALCTCVLCMVCNASSVISLTCFCSSMTFLTTAGLQRKRSWLIQRIFYRIFQAKPLFSLKILISCLFSDSYFANMNRY
jgi:hypothetical protein